METINLGNIDEIKKKFEGQTVVMYGAGGNGERILKIFSERFLKIDLFCDDDYNKWGTYLCDIPIISFDELSELSRKKKVNVILTSVFAGAILGRLDDLDVTVYEPFSMLIDQYYKSSFYQVHLSEEKIFDLQGKIRLIQERINDKESVKILDKIAEAIKTPNIVAHSHFFDVASKEDCYFIHEVLESIPENPVILDCGGFTGDLMVALDRHDIDYDRVYSFEVNKRLYDIMQENIDKNNLVDKFIPVNKGVWDNTGTAYLHVSDDDIAGGSIDGIVKGTLVDTVKIDDYFENIRYDLIKMDIEGAELNAIQGGITIKKYRPIMAISLYHSINDVVEIPLYLFEKLERYKYLIRHHSFIGSETVLYCIPCEKM